MKDEIKEYLEAYLGDLRYWCGFKGDVESVNHYTSGTREFSSIDELREYTLKLETLLEENNYD